MELQVIQIEEGFWSLEMGFVRAYLAEGDDCAFLFDTGIEGCNIKEKASEITDKKIIVLNTHSDPDHVGGNAKFNEVWLHPADYFKYLKDGGQTFSNVNALKEGQLFENGSFCFETIYLPGHTPGSVAFLEKEKRFLIAGDMFSIMVYLWGEGRNIYAYMNSLEVLEKRKDEFDKIYAYHGSQVLEPDVIDHFRECAEGILNGSIKGFKDTGSGFETGDALIYTTGKANILFDPIEAFSNIKIK